MKNNNYQIIGDPVLGELRVYGDSIVCGDFHSPQQNSRMIDYICRVSEQTGIRQLIINGDIFNMDAPSTFKRKQSNSDWETEKKVTRNIFQYLDNYFDYIFLVYGNHDKRLAQKN